MSKVKCKNCVFSLDAFCVLSGEFVAEGTKLINCDSYEEDDFDYNGMDLTDSEIYIRSELATQDSVSW